MTQTLSHILDHDLHELRQRMKDTLNHPLFQPCYHLSLEQERELAYQRLKHFLSAQHISVFDFDTDPRRIFAAHEVLGLCEGSMTTKFTVQMNLFGGTLLRFGRHPSFRPILEKISQLEDVGCFGLTELGYGNNAVEMETTATYVESTDEFIINSPSELSQKYWITNGYCHAHWCIVFAQLIIKEERYGVHGFLVPIRDQELNHKTGVTVQDMGYKIGLNGVDNARIWFNNVHIPRQNLLDAFSQVSDQGQFTSTIKGMRARFIKMADQLLSGRICIAAMTLSAAKSTLYNTVRYAQTRCGVSADGSSSTPLLNYQFQQLAIIPLLTKVVALNIGLNKVKDQYAATQVGADVTAKTPSSLIRTCCIIKPMIAWHTEEIASICRERCGGQGFLACNRFGEALASAHAAITAEGDNSVLLQKVAKELLSDVKPKHVFKHILSSLIPNQIKRLWSRNSLQQLASNRASYLLHQLALKMQRAKSKGKANVFSTWMEQEADLVQQVALAYGENMLLQEFKKLVQKENHPLLEKIYNLFGLTVIQNSMLWYLQEHLISSKQCKQINKEIATLCKQLTNHVDDILEGFNIPEHLVYAPIAQDWKKFNKQNNDNQGEVNSSHPFLKSEAAADKAGKLVCP